MQYVDPDQEDTDDIIVHISQLNSSYILYSVEYTVVYIALHVFHYVILNCIALSLIFSTIYIQNVLNIILMESMVGLTAHTYITYVFQHQCISRFECVH